MVQTINWYEKEVDDIYDHFRKLKDNEPFLLLYHMLQTFPDLEIAWIDLFLDAGEHMLEEGRVSEILDFINLYRTTFPGDFETEYEFVETELFPHLIYFNDIENIRKHLEIIKSNPGRGCSIIGSNILFQLIFNKYFDIALEYSKAVWKPLSEARDITGLPEREFCISIYLDELEKRYLQIKSGESIRPDLFKKEMEEYGFDEEMEVFQIVFNSLSLPLDEKLIKSNIENRSKDLLLSLNIQFIKYMREEFNIPFLLSDRLWNILQKYQLFGHEESPEGFFYIPYPVLSDHIDERFDSIFQLNDIEVFGKVFGLKYVYRFLHTNNLINDHYYKLMEENIHMLEYQSMVNASETLWRMKFVFNWPELYVNDPYQMEIFSDTYRYFTDVTVKENLNNYLKLSVFSERIQEEIDSHNANKKEKESEDSHYNYDYSPPVIPYVNTMPKTGRNDPCPCGSGKKYKKCCLDKLVN
ncbi:MAG: SEC-C domain-containing protein [Bacteroidales bacterium]|nr:SEC-C domain-containing protein [Bacteroidales bacterium]